MLHRLSTLCLIAAAAVVRAQGLSAPQPLVEPPPLIGSGQSVGPMALSIEPTSNGNAYLVAWVDGRFERRLMMTRARLSQLQPEPRAGVRLDTAANGWPNRVSICFDAVTPAEPLGWVVYESAPPNKPASVVALRINKDTLSAAGAPILLPKLDAANAQTHPAVRCTGSTAYVAFSETSASQRVVRVAKLLTYQVTPEGPIFAADAGPADPNVTAAVAVEPALAFGRVGVAFTAPEGQLLLQLNQQALTQVLAASTVTGDLLTPAALTSDRESFYAVSNTGTGVNRFKLPGHVRVFVDGGQSFGDWLTNAAVSPGNTTHALGFDGTSVHRVSLVHGFDLLAYYGRFRFLPDGGQTTTGERLQFASAPVGAALAMSSNFRPMVAFSTPFPNPAVTLVAPSVAQDAGFGPSRVSSIESPQRFPAASREGLLAWSEQLEQGYGVFAARLSADGSLREGPVLLCQRAIEVKPQLSHRGERVVLWWAEGEGEVRFLEVEPGALTPSCGAALSVAGPVVPGAEGLVAVARSPLRVLGLSSDGTPRDGGAALPSDSSQGVALLAADQGTLVAWVSMSRLLGGRFDDSLAPAPGLSEPLTAGANPRSITLARTPAGALLLAFERLGGFDAPERLVAQWLDAEGRPMLPLEVELAAEAMLGEPVLHDDGRRVWAAWQEAFEGGARWRAQRLSHQGQVLDAAPLELFRSRDTMPGLAMTGAGPVTLVASARDLGSFSERLAVRSYVGNADGASCAGSWDCASAVCASGVCCATACAGRCGGGSCELRTDGGAGFVDGGAPDGGGAPERATSALGCQCHSGPGAVPLLVLLGWWRGRWRRARCSP